MPVYWAVRHGVGNHDRISWPVGLAYFKYSGSGAGYRRGADHDRGGASRSHTCADVLQLLHRASTRACNRDGQFYVRILEHSGASLPFVRRSGKLMAMDPGQRGQIVSQINVTPLVDVILVLLLLFMVTPPIIQQRL